MYIVATMLYTQLQTHSGEQDYTKREVGINFGRLLDDHFKYQIRTSRANFKGVANTGKLRELEMAKFHKRYINHRRRE